MPMLVRHFSNIVDIKPIFGIMKSAMYIASQYHAMCPHIAVYTQTLWPTTVNGVVNARHCCRWTYDIAQLSLLNLGTKISL